MGTQIKGNFTRITNLIVLVGGIWLTEELAGKQCQFYENTLNKLNQYQKNQNLTHHSQIHIVYKYITNISKRLHIITLVIQSTWCGYSDERKFHGHHEYNSFGRWNLP